MSSYFGAAIHNVFLLGAAVQNVFLLGAAVHNVTTLKACSPESVFSKIPTLLAYGNATTLYADVAQFLLTRGP
jgi:hypothetical protein